MDWWGWCDSETVERKGDRDAVMIGVVEFDMHRKLAHTWRFADDDFHQARGRIHEHHLTDLVRCVGEAEQDVDGIIVVEHLARGRWSVPSDRCTLWFLERHGAVARRRTERLECSVHLCGQRRVPTRVRMGVSDGRTVRHPDLRPRR